MESATNNNYILTLAVVNPGIGSKVLTEAKNIGVSGGTIFLGKGTIKNRFLEFLGFDEEKKEIVLMGSDDKYENQIHETLTDKFHMDKPNHGIVITIPIKNIIGKITRTESETVDELKTGGNHTMEYEAVFTIVDRGLGHEVVDAANSAGARGATIINARGSGIHEDSKFFSMNIEPEKEIVMIIIRKEKSDDVIRTIRATMKIDEPGKGVMFVMDVSKTSGLFRDDTSK
jgi:nitrogen regulatory protein PII